MDWSWLPGYRWWWAWRRVKGWTRLAESTVGSPRWAVVRQTAVAEGHQAQVAALDAAWMDACATEPHALCTPAETMAQVWLDQSDAAWQRWWHAWSTPRPGVGSTLEVFQDLRLSWFELSVCSLGLHHPLHTRLRERVIDHWRQHPEVVDRLLDQRSWQDLLWPAWTRAFWERALVARPRWLAEQRHAVLEWVSFPGEDATAFWGAWTDAWDPQELLTTVVQRLNEPASDKVHGCTGSTLVVRWQALLWHLRCTVPETLWDQGWRARWQDALVRAAAVTSLHQPQALALVREMEASWLDAAVAVPTQAPGRRAARV